MADCSLQPGPTESDAIWMDLKALPELAFDHNEIVQAAKRRLLAKMSTQLAGFELLPEKFTLKQMQEMYEAALGHELDKRNFRRKILSQDVVVETGEHLSPWEESGKPPMLYILDRELYQKRKAEGHQFEIF
jgi:8-oxo-dGTP diphosphatase